MKNFLKDMTLLEWVIVVAILAIVPTVVWAGVLNYLKVCVEWEDQANSQACVSYNQVCSQVPIIDEKGTIHFQMSCTLECDEYKPCRACTKKLYKDDPNVPKEVDKPQDACDLVEK